MSEQAETTTVAKVAVPKAPKTGFIRGLNHGFIVKTIEKPVRPSNRRGVRFV